MLLARNPIEALAAAAVVAPDGTDIAPGYEHVVVDLTSPEWDFHIKPTVAAKYTPEQLAVWPIPGTVYEVKADGIPLTAVYFVAVIAMTRQRPMEAEAASDWLYFLHFTTLFFLLTLLIPVKVSGLMLYGFLCITSPAETGDLPLRFFK